MLREDLPTVQQSYTTPLLMEVWQQAVHMRPLLCESQPGYYFTHHPNGPPRRPGAWLWINLPFLNEWKKMWGQHRAYNKISKHVRKEQLQLALKTRRKGVIMKQTYCRKQKKLRKHAWNPQKQEDVTFKKKNKTEVSRAAWKAKFRQRDAWWRKKAIINKPGGLELTSENENIH